MSGHTSSSAEGYSAATATWASWVGLRARPASLPCREYCQQTFLPHGACSLPNPTGNSQAYTVELI